MPHAITIGRFFGVEAKKIDEALASYTPQNNRSQLKKTEDNTLIIDAYNANPTSMMAAFAKLPEHDSPPQDAHIRRYARTGC